MNSDHDPILLLMLIVVLSAIFLAGCTVSYPPAGNSYIYPPVVAYAAPPPGVIIEHPFDTAHGAITIIEHGISAYNQYQGARIIRDWRKGDLPHGYYHYRHYPHHHYRW